MSALRQMLKGILVAVVLLGVALVAQTGPRVEWQWAQGGGPAVEWFEIVIDNGTPVDVGLPEPVGTTYSAPMPTVTRGTHALVVRACNVYGCAASSPPVYYVKLRP